MAAQTEEWNNSLIRLTALASRLEGEGYYNIAKLARAAVDSLCRQAARQVTLPADHDRLAEEIESLCASLPQLGVDNSLIQAFERGRQALSEGRLPVVDETPNPFVCRTCGQVVVGQPGYQCPGCGAPGATLQEFPPVYWLNALLPQAALEKLRQTPMNVANIVDSRKESMSNPVVEEGGGWSLREAVAHLLDAEKVLNFRVRRMLAEDDPSLESLAVMDWAGDEGRHPPTLDEILGDYRRSRADTLATLEGIPLEDWWRTGRHAEFGPVTICQQASYFAMHEITHLPQVARLTR
jgi:hypothetical protein